MSKKITTCLVFAKEEPLKFNGLLGPIDLYSINFLVDSKGHLLKEPADKAEDNIKAICDGMNYPIISIKLYKSLLVVEVDLSDNPIYEQMNWRDIKETDTTALAWRTIHYPTTSGTVNECLGFSAAAKVDSLGGLYTVSTIIPFILT